MLASITRLLTFKKTAKQSDTRGRKAQAWGMFFVLVGLIMLISAIAIEMKGEKPEQTLQSLGLKSLEHLSIAVLLLGAVGVMLEFKSWSKYFEERLADTIMTNKYLHARRQDELGTHLINVFEAYYEKELNYKGSFLEFFRLTLQDQIVAPFREDIHTLITINKRNDGKWVVEEDTTFKCRKVSATSVIQDRVKWAISKSDIADDLEDYCVTLTLPDKIGDNFKDPEGFPNRLGQSYVFPKRHELLKALDGDVLGFELSLEPLQDFDSLRVHENLKYAIYLDLFYGRAMSLLSKGYEVVFKYPEELELVVEWFGMDKPQPIVVKQTGLYSLNYDSWLLPDFGLAYQFHP